MTFYPNKLFSCLVILFIDSMSDLVSDSSLDAWSTFALRLAHQAAMSFNLCMAHSHQNIQVIQPRDTNTLTIRSHPAKPNDPNIKPASDPTITLISANDCHAVHWEMNRCAQIMPELTLTSTNAFYEHQYDRLKNLPVRLALELWPCRKST